MMVSDSSLAAFIASNPDARELKRALAVQMTLLGLKQRTIQSILGVQCRASSVRGSSAIYPRGLPASA